VWDGFGVKQLSSTFPMEEGEGHLFGMGEGINGTGGGSVQSCTYVSTLGRGRSLEDGVGQASYGIL